MYMKFEVISLPLSRESASRVDSELDQDLTTQQFPMQPELAHWMKPCSSVHKNKLIKRKKKKERKITKYITADALLQFWRVVIKPYPLKILIKFSHIFVNFARVGMTWIHVNKLKV